MEGPSKTEVITCMQQAQHAQKVWKHHTHMLADHKPSCGTLMQQAPDSIPCNSDECCNLPPTTVLTVYAPSLERVLSSALDAHVHCAHVMALPTSQCVRMGWVMLSIMGKTATSSKKKAS